MIRPAQFETGKLSGTDELVVSVLRQMSEAMLFTYQKTGVRAGHIHCVLDFYFERCEAGSGDVGRQL